MALSLPDASKCLHFQQGETVWAQSTLPDDRLGQVLVRARWITVEQLEALKVPKGLRLGEALVQVGIITAHEVWQALRLQVENTLRSLFHYTTGTFAFVEQPLKIEKPVRLPMSTTNYILEEVCKSDELKEHLQSLGNRDSIFSRSERQASPDLPGDTLSGLDMSVLELVDGQRNLHEILARSLWSELNTLEAIARLQGAGYVHGAATTSDQRAQPSAMDTRTETTIRRAISVLREIQRVVHESASAADSATFDGQVSEARRSMQLLVPDELFEGVDVALDGVELLGAIQPRGSWTPTEQLFRDLCELLEFAVYVAPDLGPAEREGLVSHVAWWRSTLPITIGS